MEWATARSKIRNTLQLGTDLNTANSTYRQVLAANAPINSARYGYENEIGFVISIGSSAKVNIPWSVIENCFTQLSKTNGYDGKYFREHYERQAKDHGCHVHVIGQIFVTSGVAYFDGDSYRLLVN